MADDDSGQNLACRLPSIGRSFLREQYSAYKRDYSNLSHGLAPCYMTSLEIFTARDLKLDVFPATILLIHLFSSHRRSYDSHQGNRRKPIKNKGIKKLEGGFDMEGEEMMRRGC